eukprot:CAMPEP_0115324558 /NCGR_PEP_ID=MMETSP0270-20121206/82541_1 /TAXON_ID=71861 /ORGANISM="Scrippsiella trochoidea, Strain CCMP3099" /LENGTH=88 /DNA_ID=CAMNT_0002744681 /DNA_START=78 /DNA_END=344 /DNA_ORIENTATION=-
MLNIEHRRSQLHPEGRARGGVQHIEADEMFSDEAGRTEDQRLKLGIELREVRNLGKDPVFVLRACRAASADRQRGEPCVQGRVAAVHV